MAILKKVVYRATSLTKITSSIACIRALKQAEHKNHQGALNNFLSTNYSGDMNKIKLTCNKPPMQRSSGHRKYIASIANTNVTASLNLIPPPINSPYTESVDRTRNGIVCLAKLEMTSRLIHVHFPASCQKHKYLDTGLDRAPAENTVTILQTCCPQYKKTKFQQQTSKIWESHGARNIKKKWRNNLQIIVRSIIKLRAEHQGNIWYALFIMEYWALKHEKRAV